MFIVSFAIFQDKLQEFCPLPEQEYADFYKMNSTVAMKYKYAIEEGRIVPQLIQLSDECVDRSHERKYSTYMNMAGHYR